MASAKVKNLDIQNLYLLNPAAKFVLAALAIAGVVMQQYFVNSWKHSQPKRKGKSS